MIGTFEWSSSDETVATVDDNGVVTPVGEGTATITATRNDEEIASKEITVNGSKKMPFIFETSGDQEISRGELSYTYDQETGIITLNIPAVEDGGTEYRKYLINALQTNDELKDLKPLKYEVYPETGQNNAIGISAPGIDWKENNSTINAANPTVFDASGSAALSSKPVLIQVNNVQGPYVIKIHTKAKTEYLELDEIAGQEVSFTPGTKYIISSSSPITSIYRTYGNDNNVSVNGNTPGWWVDVNYTAGSTSFDLTVKQANLNWGESITVETADGNKTIIAKSPPAPNGAPRRRSAAPGTESGMPLTRFSASTLRLGKAKAYAASAPSEIPETGSADSGQKSMMSTPKRSAGTPTFEDDGYIEKTISSSDDWQLIANDLPMYNVKADGTVEPYYYWVEEVSGADGYKASYLFIDGDEHTEYSVNASTGTTPEITIQNTPDDTGVELPETGGKGMNKIYMAGGVMILLAVAGYVMFRKRVKNV